MVSDQGLVEKLVESQVINASEIVGWTHIEGKDLPRKLDDVILWEVFFDSVGNINPEAAKHSDFKYQVKKDLDLILNGGGSLLDRNEAFTDMVKGKYSLNYGQFNQDITIRLIDFDNLENNSYIVSNTVVYPRSKEEGGSEFDIVYYINGIPLVVCETKTAFRRSITAYDGAVDIADVYIPTCERFFTTNLFNFATEGKRLLYAPIGMPAIKWGPWLLDGLKETGILEDRPGRFSFLLGKARTFALNRKLTTFILHPR